MGSHHPIRKFVAPEPVAIPDKLYFRIGDVARLCQVPAYVLRFWETEFPNLKPNKGGTGQRLYRRKDVEMALRIKTLLYDQGYTIPGARQVFKSEAKPRETAGPTPLSDPAAPTLASAQTLEAAPPLQMGASIRRSAHQENHLHALRDELRRLLTELGGPASRQPTTAPPVAPTAASAATKPLRPRLVLEPKPEPQPAAPKHESNLHLAQGDLFSTE